MTILVRTCRRADLLALTLWKLADSWLPGDAQVVVSHDGPPDKATAEVIHKASERFAAAQARFTFLASPWHLGIGAHVKWTEPHLRTGEAWLVNLDDDCYVSRVWWLVLHHIAKQVPPDKCGMVVGYNRRRLAPEKDQAGVPRHAVRYPDLSPFGLISRELYHDVVTAFKPGELNEAGHPKCYDTELCLACREQGRWIVTPDRSVINHMGLRGKHAERNPPAADFLWW